MSPAGQRTPRSRVSRLERWFAAYTHGIGHLTTHRPRHACRRCRPPWAMPMCRPRVAICTRGLTPRAACASTRECFFNEGRRKFLLPSFCTLTHDHERCPKCGMGLIALALVDQREHRLAHRLGTPNSLVGSHPLYRACNQFDGSVRGDRPVRYQECTGTRVEERTRKTRECL